VLTSEFERPSLELSLDAVVGHGIGAVQFQLGSAVPDVPLRSALREGLNVLGPHVDQALCAEIHRQMEARGVKMAAVDGTFNMVDPDESRRLQNLGHLKTLIGSCGTLGTSVVTLCTGSREEIMWRWHPDNDSSAAWSDLVAVTREAADAAEAHDVTLAFEPEVNNVVNSTEKARKLIDEIGSPSLKVVMDPANIFKSGELPHMKEKLREAFALLGQDVALAHAKDLDHDGEAGHLGAGRGVLDYGLYLSLLEESGFEGTVVLHQLHGLTDPEIDTCFDFVRRSAPPSLFG
jgi:sugar phosphate isomerase/epimerase